MIQSDIARKDKIELVSYLNDFLTLMKLLTNILKLFSGLFHPKMNEILSKMRTKQFRQEVYGPAGTYVKLKDGYAEFGEVQNFLTFTIRLTIICLTFELLQLTHTGD